jgi:K+-transporting ATPase KdpF subunit
MDWTVGLAAFAAVGLACYLVVALLKPELFA